MVTQLRVLVVFQAHPAAEAVTLMLPVPPLAPKLWLVGEIEKVHGGGAPAWLTANVWPATVKEPLREDVAVLPATEYVAVPLPVPPPDVMVTQVSGLVAVHEQVLAEAVTVMLPVPALDEKDWLVGEIENVHPASPILSTKASVLPPYVF